MPGVGRQRAGEQPRGFSFAVRGDAIQDAVQSPRSSSPSSKLAAFSEQDETQARLLANCAVPMIDKARLDEIVDRTRKGGAEIVGLLKTGSAYYAPASSAVEMAEAIMKDKKKILPCAALLEGEYGYQDLYMGVPVVIGAGGVEKIVQVELTEGEKEMLAKSAASVQKVVDIVKAS